MFSLCMDLYFTFSWVLEFFEHDRKRLAPTAARLTQTYLWAFSFCTGSKQCLRVSSFNRHRPNHLSPQLPHSTACFSTHYFNFSHFSLTFTPSVSEIGQCLQASPEERKLHYKVLCHMYKHRSAPLKIYVKKNEMSSWLQSHGKPATANFRFQSRKKTYNMFVSYLHTFFRLFLHKMII